MEIIKTILLGVLILVIASVSLVGFQKADRYLNNQAIHECALAYRQEIVDETTGTTKYRPLEQQVRECVWQKGVRNWEGVWSDFTK